MNNNIVTILLYTKSSLSASGIQSKNLKYQVDFFFLKNSKCPHETCFISAVFIYLLVRSFLGKEMLPTIFTSVYCLSGVITQYFIYFSFDVSMCRNVRLFYSQQTISKKKNHTRRLYALSCEEHSKWCIE